MFSVLTGRADTGRTREQACRWFYYLIFHKVNHVLKGDFHLPDWLYLGTGSHLIYLWSRAYRITELQLADNMEMCLAPNSTGRWRRHSARAGAGVPAPPPFLLRSVELPTFGLSLPVLQYVLRAGQLKVSFCLSTAYPRVATS